MAVETNQTRRKDSCTISSCHIHWLNFKYHIRKMKQRKSSTVWYAKIGPLRLRILIGIAQYKYVVFLSRKTTVVLDSFTFRYQSSCHDANSGMHDQGLLFELQLKGAEFG